MRRRWHRRAAASLAASLLLALTVALPARPDEPLRIADVVRFLRAGISERTILLEIRERGVGEPVDDRGEAALKDAGASAAVVKAMRAAVPEIQVEPEPMPRAAVPPPPPVPRAASGPVFGVSTRTVRLPVAVTDRKGHPLTDLNQSDFRVSEEGREQQITFFSGERKPLRIALALDISGSMEKKMREVSDALGYFLDLLEPEDQILVMTFGGSVDVVQDFTSDRERLGSVFAALQPRGSTALYDAVVEGARRVAGSPAESKAIVLVTDGMDTASAASFEQAREAARRAEVPVYSIGIGHDSGLGGLLRVLGGLGSIQVGRRGGRGGYPGQGWPSGERDLDARPLLDLAEETGGRAEILKGLDSRRTGKDNRLRDAAESMALSLRYRYLLAYEPPETAGRGGWRSIKVEVGRPSVIVRARKGYYAAS
jgi:VWFA-related protein